MRRGVLGMSCLLFGLAAVAWPVAAWAGDPSRPPVQRPAEHSDEVESVEAPVVEQPATTVTEAPVVEAQPAPPPSEAALPSYSAPIAAPIVDAPPVVRDVPRDGRGMLSVGSFAVIGGAVLFTGMTVLAVEGFELDIWGPTLALGTGATIAGGLLLYGGRRRLHRYRAWQAGQPDAAPAQGNGMVGSGSALLIAGVTGAMFGTIGWVMSNIGFDPDGSRVSPIYPASFGVGVGTLAVGSALMIVGMQRHKRFQAWRTADVQLVPSVAPLPSGASVGVAGRF